MRTNYSLVCRRLAGAACLLAGIGRVSAQDALETAVRGDRSEKARQLATVPADDALERIKAGPVEFNVGLSYGLEYNDNVRRRKSPRKDDFIQTPQLDLSGALAVTDTGRLTLGVGIGYADYFKNNDLDRLYFSPNSELAYDFTVKDFRFTLFDSFDYRYDVESIGALAGVSQFPRLENTAGFRVLWVPSKWSYQAGYSHVNFLTDQNGTVDFNFSYLDRSSEQAFARVAYSLAPATQVGMEASSALTDYSTEAQADYVSSSIGPYAQWAVTEALTVTVRGGFTYYSFGSTSTNAATGLPARSSFNLSSYYSGMAVNHRLTEFITHNLDVNRAIQAGVNRGSDYTETITAAYRILWNMTKAMTLGANFNYSKRAESSQAAIAQTSLAFATDYDTYGAGVSLNYRMSRRTTATLSYNYFRSLSSSVQRDYLANRIGLRLGYQF